MAADPYTNGVPTVAPDAAPPADYQKIDATPDAFGATQGRALQQGGAELDQASNNLARIALLRQERYNQVATDDAYNKYQDKLHALTYGDPNVPGDVGIYGLKGADAMSARLPVQTQINQAREDIRAGMNNDAQRLAFDRDSRRLQSFTLSAIGRHVDAATDQYGQTVSKATIANATRDAGAYWNDDQAFNGAYSRAMEGVARGLQTAGMANNPETARAMQSAAVDGLIISRAESMAASDPTRASQWLKTGKLPDGQPVQQALSAGERFRLELHIDNLAAQSAGSNAARKQYQNAVGGNVLDDATVGRAKQVYDGLIKRGLDKDTALAFAANAVQESRADPNTKPGDMGASHGTFMWRDDRLERYQTLYGHAPEQGGLDEHLDYVMHELSGPESAAKARIDAARGPLAKAAMVSTAYERPKDTSAEEMRRSGIASTLAKKWGVGDNLPTTNDSRGPIPGSARRAAMDSILNDPSLDDKGRTAALTQLQHLFSMDDHAAHVDAEGALNEWVPKVRLNPAAVDPTTIANDTRLTGQQKDHLLTQLRAEQSGRVSGDGTAFAQTFQNIYAPAGTPGRINSQADLIPLMGNGLTFAGLEKLQKVVKERDTPDGQVRKAALNAMESQIIGTPGSMMQPGPMSKAKYADFLGVALPMERELQAKGMPLADIWSSTGPISKIVPNYVLTPAQRMQNLVSPSGGAITPPPTQAAGPRAAAPSLAQGKWYIPNGLGGFAEAAPGTPNARPYGGGPINSPDSWALPTPSAPTTEGRIQRESIGSMLGNLFGVKSEPEVIRGDQNAKYPGPSEIEAARDADAGYGSGNEAFMESRAANVLSNPPRTGQQREAVSGAGNDLDVVSKPKFGGIVPGNVATADLYTAAHLAAQRSPISALGYDPRHFNLDTKSGSKMNVAGSYDPDGDNGYVNANYASTIVHESTHRGLEILRKAGVVPEELWKRLPDEESIVRYIMASHMGDPENGRGDIAQKQRDNALYLFGRKASDPNAADVHASLSTVKDRVAALNELTGIAATYFAQRHPGGPH